MTPPEVTFETTEQGMAFTFVNGVRGTLNIIDAHALIHHAQDLPDGAKYLETGSYLGCSALLIALHSNATVWAHDVWVNDWSQLEGGPPPQVDDYFFQFYSGVKKNNLIHRIIPIRGDSSWTIGIHDAESIDLAFVDGDHSYDGCSRDLYAVLPKMKKDGVILIHDCTQDSEPLKAVMDFALAHNKELQMLPMSNGMARIAMASNTAV